MDKKIQEAMLNCTSIIETIDYAGKRSTATCFFIRNIINCKEKHFLVTNKHVLEHQKECILHADLYSNINHNYSYNHKINIDLNNNVKFHNQYDLALIDITFLNQIQFNEYIYSYSTIGIGAIPTEAEYEQFSHIQPIIMIGYPKGIYNQVFNMPIARTGTTATSLSKTYKNQDLFIIDIPSIKGSSGSPIFTEFNKKIYLVGITCATFEQKLLINKYGNRIYHTKNQYVKTDVHLGLAIRANRIKELL